MKKPTRRSSRSEKELVRSLGSPITAGIQVNHCKNLYFANLKFRLKRIYLRECVILVCRAWVARHRQQHDSDVSRRTGMADR